MPRPTREVRELRDALEVCRTHLKMQCDKTDDLRRDLEGAARANKGMQETIVRANQDAHGDAQEIMKLENQLHELGERHARVCVMFAEMALQFESCDIVK